MRCADCRDGISARLDGEDLPGEAAAVDAHLAGCAECRRFADRAAHVTRLTRTREAEPGPDLVAAVVAAAPPARPRLGAGAVRLGLGAVGLGQCALAVSGIVAVGAAHHGVELAGASAAHLSHESAAWNLALAVGFLWVAAGTTRLSGLVPLVAAFVGVLTVLSALDVLGGSVDPGRLLSHGLVVAGLVLLVVLQRITRRGGGGARAVGTPADPAADEPWTPRLPGGLPGTATDDGDGLQPTARHRAA
jgi:predicted anti-sigma-YlaC factor YlaD